MREHLLRIAVIAAGVLALGAAAAALGQGLTRINPPGGGMIMYGQVQGQSTEAGAMGYILKNLHQSIGEKPQVGKLFDVRGTDSVATFFNITRRDQGPGKPPLKVSGMLIATKVSSDHVEAAVVSDDAARFNKTLPGMMKTLMAQWHPMADARATAGSSGGGGGGADSAAQLRTVTTQDQSASIGLPAGWQLSPNQGGGGTIVVGGPNGEWVSLDLTLGATDPNNPAAQRTRQIVANGGLRNTVYANAFYYPYGGDPGRTFVDVVHHMEQKGGMRPADFKIASESSAQLMPNARCFHLEGTADFHDGKGPNELNDIYCIGPEGRAGGWGSYVFGYTAPQAVAEKERATLEAIVQSFHMNQRVVNQEAAKIAGPSITNSMRIGQMVNQRVQATHQAEDIHNSSVYQHWDSIDRRSQEFGNYQLGYAVVADTGNNAHGTLWADDAAALVQSNPDKYEYVSAPNYWKGIDY
jgi:hypothetical protein